MVSWMLGKKTRHLEDAVKVTYFEKINYFMAADRVSSMYIYRVCV